MSDLTNKTQMAVKRAYRAFASPARYEMKSIDQEILERGDNFRISFVEGELAVTTWGSGPGVLLVHGWGGSRGQMTGFVAPLLAEGFRVVAFDQPAHGQSDGEVTNIFEIVSSMNLIKEHEGSFHAIIAHSFGTLITSYALVKRNFPLPERLVYFGSLNRLMDSVSGFQALANLPDIIIDGMRHIMYNRFGKDVLISIANETLAPQINIPTLMFHDITDKVIPIEDSRVVAQVWKSAQLIETEGMGHRGSLLSSRIHEQVIEFLKS